MKLAIATTDASPIEQADDDNIKNFNNYTINNNEIIFYNMTDNDQLKNDSFLSLLNQLSDNSSSDNDDEVNYILLLLLLFYGYKKFKE